MPYNQLDVPDPIPVGINAIGVKLLAPIMNLGIIIGLTSVILVLLLGQSRIFYSMARDGCWEFAGNATCRWELTFPLHVRRSEFRANATSPAYDRPVGACARATCLLGNVHADLGSVRRDALLRGSQVSTIYWEAG